MKDDLILVADHGNAYLVPCTATNGDSQSNGLVSKLTRRSCRPLGLFDRGSAPVIKRDNQKSLRQLCLDNDQMIRPQVFIKTLSMIRLDTGKRL